VWFARFVMAFILAVQLFMVYLADKRRRREEV
jgi:hypothetical protein